MPSFSVAQTVPSPTQVARLAPRGGFSVAQVEPVPAIAAALHVEVLPEVTFAVAQVEEAPRQSPRLILWRYSAPATPRVERLPAAPRPGDDTGQHVLDATFVLDRSLLG